MMENEMENDMETGLIYRFMEYLPTLLPYDEV